MPRSKTRKTETEKPNATVAAAVEVDDAARTSADGWHSTVAYHLLTHGCFPRAPQTYAELFFPLAEYYVYHGAPLPSAHSSHDATAEDVAETGDDESTSAAVARRRRGSGPDTADAVDRAGSSHARVPLAAQQIDLLKQLMFPHGTHVVFHGTPLRAIAGQQPVLSAEVASDQSSRRPTAETGRHKRARESVDNAEPSSELTTTEQEAARLEKLILDSGRVYLSDFANDSEYLAAQEIYFVLHHWAAGARCLAFNSAVISVTRLLQVSLPTMLRPCVLALPGLIAAHIRQRRERMPRQPRIIRLARALQLSEKERGALTYTLLCHSGALLPQSSAGSLTPSSIALHAELSPQELTYFVMDSRPHIKQGLMASDIKYRTTFMECKYAMPQEAVAALAGNDLSDEQIIKLERTALAEVLAAERRDATTATASVCNSPTIAAVQEAIETGDVGSAIANVMDVVAQLKGRVGDHHAREDGSLSRDVSVAETGETDLSRDGSLDRDATASDTDHDGHHAASQRFLEDVLEDVAERNVTTAAAIGATAATKPEEEGHAAAPTGATAASPAERGVGLTMELKDIDPFQPRSLHAGEPGGDDAGGAHNGNKMHQPYTTNIEYMDESFKVLANLIKIRTAEGDMKDEDEGFLPKNKVEATLRELKGKVRVSSAVHQSRVQATMAAVDAHTAAAAAATGAGGASPSTAAFVPRIEQLCRRLKLTELEKQIMLLMIGNVVSHDILVAINGRYVMRDGQRLLTVGYILFVLCEGLQERVTARKAFYQSSALLSNGVLTLSLDGGLQRSRFNTDLMDYFCDIDRKIIDFLMGMETETSEMVPGSRLYHPQVPMSNVVLPRQTTELVLSTIEHYSLFETCRHSCGFGVGLGNTNSGLVMLFYGPSGTGKTMLANAVANELKKRILLVNVSQFKSDGKAPEMMRFVFREAKLNDAIIFFDECETLFETRESNPLVTAVLAEFENYDGLIVMATNKAQNMDEAMNRRISLMVEFKLPDHQLRERIWDSHVPKQLRCDPDVSIEKLALNFELSGGLIRNAVLAALNHAVAREKTSEPVLKQEDFETGARLQLRGFFLAAQKPQGSSEYYITPRRTMADLVVERDLQHKLEAIANLLKSRNTLFSQWGFSEDNWEHQSSLYLFHGPDGTGKSLAAEAIAYECGATIRLCNLSEVFLAREINLVKVFEEARKLGAIVVFDEAQVLFNHSEQSLQVSQLIQYHAARYPRPVLLLATSGSSDGHSSVTLDIAAAKLKFEQELLFPLPTRSLREQLWRQVFPDKVPLDEDVNFAKLSEIPGSAKLIRAVAFSACCKVALLPVNKRKLSMKMIEDELSEQRLREQRRKPVSGMFA